MSPAAVTGEPARVGMASNKEEGNGIEDMETEMSPDPDGALSCGVS